MVIGVRDRLRCGALGHGPAQEVPMDVVNAHGDRAVPVGYGGYSSVGGVGVRRDFREVVRVASRFAGFSSRPDQADEKVAVIVFVLSRFIIWDAITRCVIKRFLSFMYYLTFWALLRTKHT